MNRRPSGVTFAAVVLGIFDLFMLLAGLFYIVLAVLFAGNSFVPPASPGQPPLPPHLLPIVMGLFAAFTLLCATWGITTFAGLLRMRRWASISIMIIGGCLVMVSLFELFGCILAQLTLSNLVLPPNSGSTNLVAPNPAAMRGAFFFLDAVCLGIIAIGVWWIVYFARKSTRAAFAQAVPSVTAQLNPATPITDFSVAQPLPSTESAVATPVVVAATTAKSERPISMTIIAVLLLLGSVSLVFCCLLPYPQFMFGVLISGASKYVLLIAMALINAVAGIGLLRRIHFGWLLAVGVQILGLFNFLTFLLPVVRARYMEFMQTLSKASAPAMPDAAQLSMQAMQQKLMGEMLVPMFVIAGLLGIFILVLLWRARWYYKSSEPIEN